MLVLSLNQPLPLTPYFQRLFYFLGRTFFCLAFVTTLNAQSFIYWVNLTANSIQRSEFDGSNITTVVSGLSNPRNIFYDSISDKIYWTDRGTSKIQRSNIDGSNIEDVVTGIGSGLRQLAVDNANNHVYWIQDSTGIIDSGIWRANLDGTNIASFDTGIGLFNAQGLALDVSGQFVYSSNDGLNTIGRRTFASGPLSTIFSVNTNSVQDLALNSDGSILFWADGGGTINSGATLGLTQNQLISGLTNPSGIDVSSSYIFVGDISAGTVSRFDIDGSNQIILASGLGSVGGIAVVVPEPSTYALIAGGIALIAAWVWRKRSSA